MIATVWMRMDQAMTLSRVEMMMKTIIIISTMETELTSMTGNENKKHDTQIEINTFKLILHDNKDEGINA